MKKYIKFFISSSCDELEVEVSKWVDSNNVQIEDIKFQEIPETMATGCYITVIVIYKKLCE